MKKLLLFTAFLFLFFGAESAIIPSLTNPVNPIQHFATLSIKEVQKLAGRKLTLKEKIAVKIFQWKIKKSITHKKNAEYRDKGKTAFLFGVIALVSLLLTPVIFFGTLAALVFAIAALVTGKKALKDNPDNKKAKTAIILGWITIISLLLLAALVAVFLTSWTFGWG